MAGVAEKVRFVIEWLPALNLIPEISASKPGTERALAACKLVKFIADKTDNEIDNKLTELVTAILLTPEGAALVDWIADALRSDDDAS
jgi:hypothetical protein